MEMSVLAFNVILVMEKLLPRSNAVVALAMLALAGVERPGRRLRLLFLAFCKLTSAEQI